VIDLKKHGENTKLTAVQFVCAVLKRKLWKFSNKN